LARRLQLLLDELGELAVRVDNQNRNRHRQTVACLRPEGQPSGGPRRTMLCR